MLDFASSSNTGVCARAPGVKIGILSAQCLDRRLPDLPTLTREVEARTRARNASRARVRWMFGIEQARTKLGHAYPTVTHREAAA